MSGWSRPAFTNPTSPYFPWLILTNVIITTFMSLMTAGITIIADATIQGELALNAPEASWITTFYLLGLNSTVPASTWLGERFGYRTIYALGCLLFTIGSGFVGFATNFEMLATCRFIEGVGSGLLIPIGLAMIVRNIPKEKLPLALNIYIAISFGGGLAAGVVLSGYFAQFLSWRYLFLSLIPIGALATIDCWLFHENIRPTSAKKFDLWGFLTFISFVALLIVALSLGPLKSTDQGWLTSYILLCFGLSFLMLIVSIFIELRHPNPVLKIELFKNALFSLCILAMILLGMAFFASVSSSAEFMLNGLGYERYIVGLIASIYGLAIGLTSILASKLMKLIHPAILMLIGLSFLIFSYFIANELTLQSYPWQVIVILALRGIGVGLSLGPTTAIGVATVPKEMAAPASMMLTFFRQVGATYGGTILTILVIKRKIFHVARFSETVSSQIPGYLASFDRLYTKFSSAVSEKNFFAARQAKLEIVRNIETQAYIQAINDSLMVFGYITLAVALLLLALLIAKRKEIFKRTP